MPVFRRPDSWPSKPSHHLRPDWSLSEQISEPQTSLDGSSRSDIPGLSRYGKQVEPDSGDKNHISAERAICTDRAELIERIKRGESPTWVPSQALQQEYLKVNGEPLRPPPSRETKPPSPLLAAAQIEGVQENTAAQEELHSPYEIERPHSALHTGDFTEAARRQATSLENPLYASNTQQQTSSPELLNDSSTHPWYPLSPALEPYNTIAPWILDRAPLVRQASRNRAPSLSSYSSASYIFKTPTTPLVQQSNNTDLDSSSRDRSASPDKDNGRHTLPPDALHDWHLASTGPTCSASPSSHLPRPYRREANFPFVHEARRSLNATWSLQHPPSPPTPRFFRSRRASFSSEASPRQRASMVGSYEESILHGRMSTPPSKPFDFTAHIGALGKGKKPRMPAHVIVPFQAVFYDWPSSNGRSTVNDEPSPYVGHIDLEHPINPTTSEASGEDHPGISTDESSHGRYDSMTQRDHHPGLLPERAKKRKRVTSFVKPPHGSYRIPEQGQIQVVIKNPYKTALKLFLVPYDLSGMEPGQKTFVRQRYYSAGPIIERPIISSAISAPQNQSHQKKPILRYLIHLNMCCPARQRYYLYQHIRVVFANRVPDDKEYLSQEIQEPKPKYTSWKPSTKPLSSSNGRARLNAEKAVRRRSLGHNYSNHPTDSRRMHSYTGGSYPYAGINTPPVPSIPFLLPSARRIPDYSSPEQNSDSMDVDESRPTTSSSLASPLSNKSIQPRGLTDLNSGDRDTYIKLNKGEVGYGGLFGHLGIPEPGEGLLARRLRGLGVQSDINMREKED